MPYVRQDRREILEPLLAELSSAIQSPGDFNYVITRLLVRECPDGYADYNALIGVLECAKLEYYRRAVAVYEDQKIRENGDVY